MSLDVYLYGPEELTACECRCACGERHSHDHMSKPTLFGANYTHNGTAMADAAGIYAAVWRPDENGITHAAQLIEPLRVGIAAMEADPARFVAVEPPNKWGSFASFLPWCKEYLAACEANPTATVEVSR